MNHYFVIKEINLNLFVKDGGTQPIFVVLNEATNFDSYEEALQRLRELDTTGHFQIDKIFQK